MAHSALKKKETKEYFDAPDVLATKVRTLAEWIRGARHFIAFTGAGISTSTGIPDFRSGTDTVLGTGGGVWELRALKQARSSKAKTTTTLKAIPSPTHMTLVALQAAGYLKHLTSQNTDGLHRRSGFPPEALAELHGNSNLEKCEKCGRNYLRDYKTRNSRGKGVHYHYTGRICTVDGCLGKLKDSIINFGENLPDRDMDLGFAHAAEADLCLAMGSSLRVTPAADMPENVAHRRAARLVIVNLQKTPLDRKAAMVIHAKCDDVSRMLAEELSLHVSQFRLRRFIRVKAVHKARTGRPAVVSTTLEGTNIDGTPFSLFTSVQAKCAATKDCKAFDKSTKKEPFRFNLEFEPTSAAAKIGPTSRRVNFTLNFNGHYKEPALELPVFIPRDGLDVTYVAIYNPFTRKWARPVPVGSEAASTAADEAAAESKREEPAASAAAGAPTARGEESAADGDGGVAAVTTAMARTSIAAEAPAAGSRASASRK